MKWKIVAALLAVMALGAVATMVTTGSAHATPSTAAGSPPPWYGHSTPGNPYVCNRDGNSNDENEIVSGPFTTKDDCQAANPGGGCEETDTCPPPPCDETDTCPPPPCEETDTCEPPPCEETDTCEPPPIVCEPPFVLVHTPGGDVCKKPKKPNHLNQHFQGPAPDNAPDNLFLCFGNANAASVPDYFPTEGQAQALMDQGYRLPAAVKGLDVITKIGDYGLTCDPDVVTTGNFVDQNGVARDWQTQAHTWYPEATLKKAA